MNHLQLRGTSTLALVLIATGTGIAAAALRGGPESAEARALKEKYARQVQRIQSLEVAYKLTTKSNLSPEELRALPEYQNQLFLPQDEWKVAFKGAKRFKRQIQPEQVAYLAPVGEYGLAAPREPAADAPPSIKENQKQLKAEYDRAVAAMKAQEARGAKPPLAKGGNGGVARVRPWSERDVTYAFNGKTLWSRRSISEKADEYQIWRSSSKPNWFQVSSYLAAVGLHVPDPRGEDLVRKAQSIFQVAEWIKDRSYEVEPKTEVVDGCTCIVLKGSLNSIRPPGYLVGDMTDRIWVDRDHGLVMRKREMSGDGRLTNRWETFHLREVEPGIWLPLTTRHDQFSTKPLPELQDKPVLIEEIQVQSLAINKVADDRFDMTPKTGDVIEDLRGRF
jgi:hypothetical protein